MLVSPALGSWGQADAWGSPASQLHQLGGLQAHRRVCLKKPRMEGTRAATPEAVLCPSSCNGASPFAHMWRGACTHTHAHTSRNRVGILLLFLVCYYFLIYSLNIVYICTMYFGPISLPLPPSNSLKSSTPSPSQPQVFHFLFLNKSSSCYLYTHRHWLVLLAHAWVDSHSFAVVKTTEILFKIHFWCWLKKRLIYFYLICKRVHLHVCMCNMCVPVHGEAGR